MTLTVRREKAVHRKKGAQRGEKAIKHRKDVNNFKQSRDIHEDRMTVQKKNQNKYKKIY